MTDPMTATAASLAATMSGVALALLGVDHYSLLYGMVGALLALASPQSMGRVRAIVHVVLATFVGAALGNAAMVLLPDSVQGRPILILGCLLGGYGAHVIAASLLRMVVSRLDRMNVSSKKPEGGS